jgi:hypothetical protein
MSAKASKIERDLTQQPGKYLKLASQEDKLQHEQYKIET